jgi:hypothetical protein
MCFAQDDPIVEPWLLLDFASGDVTLSLRALAMMAIQSQSFHIIHRPHAYL